LKIDMTPGHYAIVCNLPGHYGAGMHQDFTVTPAVAPAATLDAATAVQATVKDMSISLSSSTAPAGNVTFTVTNEGPSTHEFVVLNTTTQAADFPIASFEGEKDRFNEDANGITNAGEAGEVPPGTTKTLKIDMTPGHYAIVCNLPGHYRAGMHQDFTVT
jgi:uncharacterized cupredoxin-like copper-binding protein